MAASSSSAPPAESTPDTGTGPDQPALPSADIPRTTHAWRQKTGLTLDGGGTRSFASLLMLQQLMEKIAELELNHPDGPHTSSFQGGNISPEANHVAGPSGATSANHQPPPLQKQSTFQTVFRRSRTGSRLEERAELTRQELDDREKFLPCHYFDYIAGTSAGGLNATMLGRLRMSADEAVSRYPGMAQRIFGHKRVSFHGMWRSKYDALHMERVVQELVEERIPTNATDRFRKFKSPPDLCRTILMAKEIGQHGNSEGPYMFRTYDHPRHDNSLTDSQLLNLGPAQDCFIWQAARATSAAPIYFKEMQIGSSRFSDGGIRFNDPSELVFTEVLHREGGYGRPNSPSSPSSPPPPPLHPPHSSSSPSSSSSSSSSSPCPVALVLSLGTGRKPTTAARAKGLLARQKHYRRLSDILHRFWGELTGTRDAEAFMRQTAASHGFLYHKWTGGDVVGGVRLDDAREATFENMRAWVDAYLAEPDVAAELAACAELLVRRRRERIREDADRWKRFSTCVSLKCPCCSEVAGTKEGISRHIRAAHGEELSSDWIDKLQAIPAWKRGPWPDPGPAHGEG